ncbi:hypothetical protein AV530_010474 [Patagioenas fasciata monilis]|uniref:Uncharacterized protein n=1 Tax=Patagioenas fasciata monilis TaxID=372326 RepID=A0A1V4KF59_PATFA|nr:hypothetical protein AV530_010474 [Patagioenas fasciata monilis]
MEEGKEESAETGRFSRPCPSPGSCMGMRPSNWQGCCKLLLGGGNNHHLEASPSQIHSTLAAQDSPVMDKAF